MRLFLACVFFINKNNSTEHLLIATPIADLSPPYPKSTMRLLDVATMKEGKEEKQGKKKIRMGSFMTKKVR